MSYFQHMTNGEVSEEESVAHRAEEVLVPATAM